MAKAGIVYVGSDDGLVVFSDPASIGRWRRVGHELAGTAVLDILAHSALALDVALGDTGVQHSNDGGQSWRAVGAAGALALAGNPAMAATLFALLADGTMQRSDDGGEHWRTLNLGKAPSRPNAQAGALLVDPQIAERVLVALSGGEVWASTNGGQQWDQLGAGLPMASCIVASPGRANTLFATAAGALWRAGVSGLWAQLSNQINVSAGKTLAMLPGKQEVLLVTTMGDQGAGIARSDDDGLHWQPATFDTPPQAAITTIVAATYHIDTAWAGSADGQLLLSSDRGRSWQTIVQGLAPIRSLAAVRLA